MDKQAKGSNGNGLIERYGRGVIRWRWLVLLASFSAMAVSFYSISQNVKFSTDYRDFFGPGNPQVLAFDKIEADYTKLDQISFILAPEEGTVLSPRIIESMRWMTEEGWQLPYATRVDSLTNFQNTTAIGDDLNVEPLVTEYGEVTQADVDRVREVALNEPLLTDSLISKNLAEPGQYGAVAVTFTLPKKKLSETPEAVAAARDLEQRYMEKYPGVKIYMIGPTMLSVAFLEASKNDSINLTPIQYLVIISVLWLLLRSVSGLISTMLVITASALAAFGIATAMGITITSITATTPTIIMTLAVADSIHLLVAMLLQMRKGASRDDALVESLRLNMGPVFLTSITTAVGFLSMNFSDSPPLRDLGNISAIGVMMAFLFSVTTLPAVMAILPVKVRQSEDRIAAFSSRYGGWLVGRWQAALVASAIVVGGLGWMAQYNKFGDDDFVRYFSEDIRFRTDTDFARDHYSGFMGVFYDLDTKEDWGVAEPDYLRKLEAFEAWWYENPDVTNVRSIAPLMKRINKSMNGDAPAAYAIPDERALSVENLFLYEMSLPFGLDINQQINSEKSGSLFRVTFGDVASEKIRRYGADGEQWLKDNAPELLTQVTGPPLMFAHISLRNIESMQSGTLIAMLAISALLMIALRNLKLGALSLVPNLLPLIMTLGVWAIIHGNIIFTNAVVSGMVLGIVVDYTIHFLSKYLRARREMGLSTEAAVRSAFTMVGAPIVATSVILVAGFLVLTTSDFAGNSTMAGLTSIAIVLALICDFVLLPALLMWLDNSERKATR
jgi:predicted RND superfamily exporter protein